MVSPILALLVKEENFSGNRNKSPNAQRTMPEIAPRCRQDHDAWHKTRDKA